MKNITVDTVLKNKILPFVTKPARYVGNELNIVQKDVDSVDVRVALAFPEVYEIAMSYIGFEILYHVLNSRENIWAERVYAPWPDMNAMLNENKLSLYSLESFTPLKEFDIIGFTFQYELTFTNVLNMLNLSNIAIRSEDRDENDPIILAGGPSGSNPEPMADFIDAYLIGDGEEGFVEICNLVGEARKEKKSRSEILEKLAQIRGVYVPSFYEASYDKGNFSSIRRTTEKVPARILTRILSELKPEYYPDKPIVPLIEVTHNRLSVEVMRGCTEGCRFCNAGMTYRPTRERSKEDIVSQTLKMIASTGHDEISFLSLSISDYSDLKGLMQAEQQVLDGLNVNVSFPSMRLDKFDEEIAEFASRVRKSGFTFAPEAGSARLRSAINKNITDEHLFDSVHIALRNGWKVLKFYFMIGLPTETKEDIEALADLIEKVVEISKSYGRIQFNVSVSPFSPKPHTPFQWEKQDTRTEFLEKINILRKRFARFRQVKFSWRDPEVSLVECVLGRGDRRVAKAIQNAWEMGAIFDGWSDHFNFDIWTKSFEMAGLSLEQYSREFDIDQPVPWDHIDKGVTKNYLLRERLNAYDEKNKFDCKEGTCYGCGIQRKGGFREFADCYTQLKLHEKAPDKELLVTHPQEIPEKEVSAPKESDAAAGKKIRIRYQKTEYARYLSHLDLVRIFGRACRRAEIPLMYSQGFNPHPKLSFGPPLSLGYTSNAEYMDLEIEETYAADLKDTLNPFLPGGLKIIDSMLIRGKVETLASVINGAEYEIDISDMEFEQVKFEESLKNLLEAVQIEVEREVKGKHKIIDIRPFIVSIQRSEKSILVKTRNIEMRTVRMKELLDQLFQYGNIDVKKFHVHRREQLILQGESERNPIEALA